jgi:[glutamine synthetase] adenylyltransferase / [glutamine synthetase]-adenylyl-L-tyrosine phosphorylase
MTRARFVLGQEQLGQRFEAVRSAVINAERDHAALAREIGRMREKVRLAHPVPQAVFDVKHSPGGMVDVEFVVQYLVLAHGPDQTSLHPNVGNIALLMRAQDVGLLPQGMGVAAGDAYRVLRALQHKARLDEEPTQVPVQQVQAQRDAVLALWHHVMAQGI